MVYDIQGMDDWSRVVKDLVPTLTPGTILTLSGPLGAGKTTFVQCLVQALGSKHIPKSPTFALLCSYPVSGAGTGIRHVLHVDAYRLESSEDVRVLNLDEEIQVPGTLIVIEWPENIEEWLKRRTSAVRRMSIHLHEEKRGVFLD